MGARPLIDLKTMAAVSSLIMSWTVGHLSSFIKFAAGVLLVCFAIQYKQHKISAIFGICQVNINFNFPSSYIQMGANQKKSSLTYLLKFNKLRDLFIHAVNGQNCKVSTIANLKF